MYEMFQKKASQLYNEIFINSHYMGVKSFETVGESFSFKMCNAELLCSQRHMLSKATVKVGT